QRRAHDGTAAAVDQHQPVRQMQQECVHRQTWRDGAECRVVQRPRLAFGQAGDKVEEIECIITQHPVVQRRYDDIADAAVLDPGRLLCGCGWTWHRELLRSAGQDISPGYPPREPAD